MSDNNITNIKTIIPGQNQNNLLTISGDLLVDGSLNILSISPPSGSNNIDIFGNLLMNDFKISNVGELIMNGNIDLSGNNKLKYFSIYKVEFIIQVKIFYIEKNNQYKKIYLSYG